MVWIWPIMKVDQAAAMASTLQHHQLATKTMFTDNFPHLSTSNEIICILIVPVPVEITSLPRPK